MGGPKSVELKPVELKTVELKTNATKSSDGQQSSPATDDKIRQAAYQKWQEAGCPSGDGVEFWLAAEAELTSNNRPTKPR